MNFIFLILSLSAFAESPKGHFKKSQDVNFEGSEVDGIARTPDGANVVQKRGVQFVPLYDVKNHMNENIESAVDYLK